MNLPPDNILADPDALFAWFMLADPRIILETAAYEMMISDWVAIAQDKNGQWFVYNRMPTLDKLDHATKYLTAWVGGTYLGLGHTETLPDWHNKVWELTRHTS